MNIKKKIEQIISRKFYSSTDYDSEEWKQFPQAVMKTGYKNGDLFEYLRTNLEDNYEVGDHLVVDAGAPGYGSITYKITEVNELGVFGNIINNNIKIFSEEDVI